MFPEETLSSAEHPNGGQLVVKYLSERKWSKTLRDTTVRESGDNDQDYTSVGQLYMELCKSRTGRHFYSSIY